MDELFDIIYTYIQLHKESINITCALSLAAHTFILFHVIAMSAIVKDTKNVKKRVDLAMLEIAEEVLRFAAKWRWVYYITLTITVFLLCETF